MMFLRRLLPDRACDALIQRASKADDQKTSDHDVETRRGY